MSEPLTVKETVAKETGSEEFESMSLRLTETVFCAEARMLTKRARKNANVLIECFIVSLTIDEVKGLNVIYFFILSGLLSRNFFQSVFPEVPASGLDIW